MLTEALDWLGFGASGQKPGSHGHSHSGGDHGHTHGVVDATIVTTSRGIWAIKWSFVVLAITALMQLVVVIASGSVALLADTIHNVADATTAIPLWVAFRLVRRRPTKTFTFGYGKVEDLAGILIVLIILASALVAGYEAVDRLLHPQPITLLGWVAVAGLVGFVGNEAVAVLRIRVGRQINSAALIADGYHARVDGLTSLAVVAGALGVWLGFPLADPIIGILITFTIFGIVWQSARSVLTRMLDGVEPGVVNEVIHAGAHVPGIQRLSDVRVRWLGHRMYVQATVHVDAGLTVAQADEIRAGLDRALKDHVPPLADVHIQVCAGSGDTAEAAAQHHHAPEPFRFASPLATGVLEIVDTPDGERLRLTLEPPVDGIGAVVGIKRQGGVTETHPLLAVTGVPGRFQSTAAPAEPHEFQAWLQLDQNGRREKLAFKMVEPDDHHH